VENNDIELLKITFSILEQTKQQVVQQEDIEACQYAIRRAIKRLEREEKLTKKPDYLDQWEIPRNMQNNHVLCTEKS
jgi:hypothetical protein